MEKSNLLGHGLVDSVRWLSIFFFVDVELTTLFSIAILQQVEFIVYVDDIVITGDDSDGTQQYKFFLQSQFQTMNLRQLKYCFGIEVARSQSGIYLSQRKSVLDLLNETGMLGYKPVDTPMDQHTKLIADQD